MSLDDDNACPFCSARIAHSGLRAKHILTCELAEEMRAVADADAARHTDYREEAAVAIEFMESRNR